MTIIVLLILAGVSLNAIIGNDGIVTQAQGAKELSEEADRMEELQLMLVNYTSDLEKNSVMDKYLKSREGKEIESSFKMDVDGSGKRKNIVEKDGYYYAIEEDGNGNYSAKKLTEEQIGEKIEILTSDNFDGNGELAFNPGKGKKETLVFGDEIKEGEFCFDIQSGEVTIYIDYDMELTNEGLKRSAINIEPEAKLNLYVDEGKTLTVNSGLGEKGDETDYMKVNQGGYAGIRVPSGATLTLHGSGTLVAYGGDAGDGNRYSEELGSGIGGTGGRSELEQESVGNRRNWSRVFYWKRSKWWNRRRLWNCFNL